MVPDDYDDTESEEEDFHEAPETSPLTKYDEIVFCPKCDAYMPYLVEGALVRRKCPSCGKLFEGGVEVEPGGAPVSVRKSGTRKKTSSPAPKKTPAQPRKPARPSKKATATSPDTCAATTKSGTPCSNRPRKGSKYCSSHKGWRPPRK